MRLTASGICSDRTMRPTPDHKCGQNCGQSRFLQGSIFVLWLLPELDSNQQPCD